MYPIVVAKDGFGGTRNAELVEELKTKHGVEAILGDIPIDLMWTTIDGKPVMGDLKKPADLIASALDGRLHNQTSIMHGPDTYGFILLEADGVGYDSGRMVGNKYKHWTWEQFDGLLQSLQEEGIIVVRSANERLTGKRIAYLYRRLNDLSRGSWHKPVPILPPAVDFLDVAYREKVGFLMHVGRDGKGGRGMGQVNAERLLQEFGLMGTLGITNETLEEALTRWKNVKGVGPKSIIQWKKWLQD